MDTHFLLRLRLSCCSRCTRSFRTTFTKNLNCLLKSSLWYAAVTQCSPILSIWASILKSCSLMFSLQRLFNYSSTSELSRGTTAMALLISDTSRSKTIWICFSLPRNDSSWRSSYFWRSRVSETVLRKGWARGSVKKYALPFGTRSLRARPGFTKQISPANPRFATSFRSTTLRKDRVKVMEATFTN